LKRVHSKTIKYIILAATSQAIFSTVIMFTYTLGYWYGGILIHNKLLANDNLPYTVSLVLSILYIFTYGN
jgi:hypothetical protein